MQLYYLSNINRRTDGLDIIDLDSPLNPPRHLRHGLPWLVADVQWSPFAARDYWVVSTANQKALVWNLNMQEDAGQGAIEHTLRGHTRAITDINFSAHHPDMLATCAIDGYVHAWDLRRPRQPALTFIDWFAGATQVKYNRQDSHILASSHDRWLRIWDDRFGAAPLRSINAHESKIYGVDWNRTRATGVVTCSLDRSIKFWDYGNDVDEPERIIRTDFPVWRARHTPFGWGLLAMPQDTPGNLHLYDRRIGDGDSRDCYAPTVAQFSGHGDSKVKEFLWRSRGGITDDGIDNREYQLVSWGDDNQLRLKRVDDSILAGVGYVKGTQVRKKLNVTRKGAVYKTFRSVENNSKEKKSATITGPPRPNSSGAKMSAITSGIKQRMKAYENRGSVLARAPAMKARDRFTKAENNKQKQIGWISGIRFSKIENGAIDENGVMKRHLTRRVSLLDPDYEEDWEAQEDLHAELVRVAGILSKVKIDKLNMDKRTVNASLNGPWGKENESIYVMVKMAFPEQYPQSKSPSFTIGKTSLMRDGIHQKLTREVQQIADGFISRGKGCLEATLCYLLGEVDLESSTTLFGNVADLDDDLDALADESSSDDETQDMPADAAATMSQELDSSGATNPPPNSNVNVPLPRYCGARFSAHGKLVCFFPPKEEKLKDLTKELFTRNNARSRGRPLFESVGRLHSSKTSLGPRIKTLSIASENRTETDDSDESDRSSSEDSNSSSPFPGHPLREYMHPSTILFGRPKRGSPSILSQRSSAGGTGTNTGTGTGTAMSKGRASKPKNLISLHPIQDLLPSKIELAVDYAVYGDGPDVCEHNADVAIKHGYEDLADVWRYAAMLLHNDVPLEVLDQTHRREPILVIARDAVRHNESDSGSDSGVDLSQDLHNPLNGRVKWGTSPLATQMINDLFSYFEKLADIQMLAMLSCVFSEPLARNATMQAEMDMTQPQTPLPMKTPAFSLDYFPTDAAAWSMYQRTPINSVATTPKTSQTPTGFYGSVGSSNGIAISDPASASYSCGETPPMRSTRGSSDDLKLHSQSLSTSPENGRTFRRANSVGLASSFAASFSRPFSLASASPPNPNRKRPSPVDTIINSLAPSAITWGNTTVLGSVKETATGRSSYSDDEALMDDWKPTICTGISLTMENQNAFDDEGSMSTPLLAVKNAALYASYRSAYAELLYAWGHPLARLEILKFNGLKDYFTEPDVPESKSMAASIRSNDTHSTNHGASPPSPIILGKKDIAFHLQAQADQGLDATGYCLIHESRLEPLASSTAGGAIGRCDRCKAIQRQLRCTVCLEPISAVYSPCLNCGCAAHEDCLLSYHAEGSTFCPGGCDCDCGAKASAGIVESWEILQSAIEQMRLLDALHNKNKSKQPTEEWVEEKAEWSGHERADWEHIGFPSSGLGKGVSTLGRRLGQVRAGDWGMSSGKKKPSSLRNEERA